MRGGTLGDMTSTASLTTIPSPGSAAVRDLAPLAVEDAAAHFKGGDGYLNACSLGLPPSTVVTALAEDAADWEAGLVTPRSYSLHVERARARFARLVGCNIEKVAIGSQTSVIVSLFAAAVPTGAEVLCVDGDFSSMVYPFLVAAAAQGYTVRHVPLDELASQIGPRTAVVAFSLVQSLDGAIADAAAIREAARLHGALTVCDLTQAAGAMPVSANDFDATITSAYKWLMCPRGVSFLTLNERAAAQLQPRHAGWYAGHEVTKSFYGPAMTLARTARRFDVSPAFSAWVGADAALAFLERIDITAVWAHDVALGDAFAVGVGSETRGRAIVTLEDREGVAFDAACSAGLRVTAPEGRLRVSFHVWNTSDDVHRAVAAVRGSGCLA